MMGSSSFVPVFKPKKLQELLYAYLRSFGMCRFWGTETAREWNWCYITGTWSMVEYLVIPLNPAIRMKKSACDMGCPLGFPCRTSRGLRVG